MHTTQLTQNRQLKPILVVSGIYFPDCNNLVQKTNSGLIQYRGKKNRTNYLHAYRNRTNLPCDVCQGLKCGAFEQDFTDFGWIFAVRILGLEGERERVKSETVKMGGERPFILRMRSEYVI